MEHQFIISFQIGGFCPLSTDMVCMYSFNYHQTSFIQTKFFSLAYFL